MVDESRAVEADALTPTQRHYLLKVLICAELHDEFALIDEKSALLQYGPPFVDTAARAKEQTIPTRDEHQANGSEEDERTSRPLILLHLFHAHMRRFPGLDTAKSDYWRKCILPIFERFDAAHFSSSAERSEVTVRKLINVTSTRYVATYWARGVGVRGQGEQAGPSDSSRRSNGKWGQGKSWGEGTVKRGLARPLRPSRGTYEKMDNAVSASSSATDKEIWATATANTKRVKENWLAWKEEIIESDTGLQDTLEVLKEPSMDKIPARYRSAAEWVRHHVAFVLWSVLVRFPGGDNIFDMIKTIHNLFPYWAARQLLKIANAQTMIKAMIDMVLARPIGADSLGQRIFFVIMRGEIQTIEKKMLVPLRKAIGNDKLCDAIDAYVVTRTKEDRIKLIKGAQRDKCDILIKILERQQAEQVDEVRSWQAAFASSPFAKKLDWAYPDEARKAKHVSAPPADVKLPKAGSDAYKFAHLKLYLRERLRRRDREEVRSIGAGALVPDAIRASMEVVFYKTLHAIAKASDLPSRLANFQKFMDDLIEVKGTKRNDLEDWIALCARHEKDMYYFVHEIRDAIMPIFDWCQEALDYMALSTSMPWDVDGKDATTVELDLDEMLADVAKNQGKAQAGKEDILAAVHKELRDIERYVRAEKVKSDFSMRKEYALMRNDTITNVTLVDVKGQDKEAGPASDVQAARNHREKPSEPLQKKLRDLEADLPPDWLEADESRTVANGNVATKDAAAIGRATDSPIVPWGYYMPEDLLLRQYIEEIRGADKNTNAPSRSTNNSDGALSVMTPPQLTNIRRHVLPVFRSHLRRRLPDWINLAKP